MIIPAVDLQDGCVVRFVQGRLNKKIYSRDPVKTAKHWARQGAKMIHVVDLDGANTGVAKNIGLAQEIAKTVDIPVQFGGGVRTLETIKTLLDAGVSRVILGTKAIQDKGFLQKAFKEFRDNIIVSIDARDGQVFVQGWQAAASVKVDAQEFARTLKEIGFRQAIYTDISKDGTLKGPNIIDTKRLLKTGLAIIASGGVSSLEDIQKLKVLENDGLAGIIVGKALYEGKFTLSQALKFT